MLPPDLHADGEQVRVHTIAPADVAPYRRAVEQSRRRIARWNPVNPDDIRGHLAAQSRSHRTFLVRAHHPEGDHDVVGKVNVTGVVHGRFRSAALGYDAYDPYAGRGLFSEGISLVIGVAFAAEPEGMGLHRVEANVQPGNVTSAGLLRGLGFRYEGFTPRMMWMADVAGREQWRDHDRYALTAEEWPAPAFPAQEPHRLACLVGGEPGPGRTGFARRLARELALPLFSQDVVNDQTTLYRLLAESPVGAVVEADLSPDYTEVRREVLAGVGLDPAAVLEIWCRAGETDGSARTRPWGEVLSVDTSSPVPDREVVRAALEVRRVTALRARPAG
jgi:ribosomal-protein-alanine N-acetyltransferase